MHERGDNRFGAQTDLLVDYFGDGNGMEHIGDARLPSHVPVGFIGNIKSPFDHLPVFRGIAPYKIVYQRGVFIVNELNIFLVEKIFIPHRSFQKILLNREYNTFRLSLIIGYM